MQAQDLDGWELQNHNSTITLSKSNIAGVVRKEVLKLFDASIIYPISDSAWVSAVQIVSKKGCITMIKNINNELIPTRTNIVWGVCMFMENWIKPLEKTISPYLSEIKC